MKNVLFVCTGNTCRSCMAEGIFNSLTKNAGKPIESFLAISAGVAAYDGETASKNAIDALSQEWGIDITGHSSRQLKAEDIREAGLILTMGRSHKNYVISMFPEAAGKIYTLKEYVLLDEAGEARNGYEMDIPDPYGMPLDVYKSCARDIKRAVEALLKKLAKGQ